MFLLKLISMQQIQVTMVMNTVKHLQLFIVILKEKNPLLQIYSMR